MAIISGVNINTSGLILSLDASSNRSYSGSGNTWYDLSGNNNSGTGQTGISYSSSNRGKFILDGSPSGYFALPLLTNAITNISMCCWVNITSTSLRGPFIVNGSANGYAIGVGNDSYDTLGNNLIGLFPYERWIGTGVALGLGWKYVVLTLDGSSLPRIYLNGQLINSYAGGNPRTPSTNAFIGREVGGESLSSLVIRAFGGEVSLVKFYNRALSAQEIKNNFEATRDRYGI
jgi:hypothetical protein